MFSAGVIGGTYGPYADRSNAGIVSSYMDFGAGDTILGGKMSLNASSFGDKVSSVAFEFGTAGSAATADFGIGAGPQPGVAPVTNVTAGTTPPYALCTCAFLQWGSWDTTFTAASNTITGNGVWVAGLPAPGADFDAAHPNTSAVSATYTGTAIGTVAGAPAPAQGTMSMTYNFGPRTGALSITNFAGMSFLNEPVTGAPAGPTFSTSGVLAANGSFVSDGTDTAAGVMGTWSAKDGGWSASGIFGARK